MPSTNQPLRFAVIGAHRGRTFIHAAAGLDNEVKLAAVCDIDPEALAPWQDNPDIVCLDSYEQVLNDPNIDAVCVATPVKLHAEQAIAALKAGKHVLSEVTAAFTMDECWGLVEAVESSGRTYMMAENYCYMRENLLIQNMVDLGVFGDITFASGAYLHDCRDLLYFPDGKLTWRGSLRQNHYGNTYPTHSAGPVAKWLGINKHDSFATTTTWQSRAAASVPYVKANFPEGTQGLPPSQWQHGDSATTLVQSKNGILMDFRFDCTSPRPHNMARHELQGTRASFTSQDHPNTSLIWIQDRSETTKTGVAEGWELLSKYYDEFEHPLWKAHLEQASKAGHGGGDYFVLREFAAAVREGRPPYIDVYDAVTWSSLTPLSMTSVANGNIPVAVPDFKAGRP